MLYIIFIILVIGTFCFIIFTYESRISNLKNNLIILNSTLNTLKSKIPKGNGKINITFKVPEYKTGIIQTNSFVFLSPDENGVIEKTNVNMEVLILDEALYEGKTWFYVALPVSRYENSRGWVQQKNFTSLKEKSVAD